MDKFIRTLDFCQIVSDKFAEEAGVKRGAIVYVAGLKALPISDEDPYTQRIKFFCHLVKDGHVDPSQLYVIDPNSIQKVSKSRQKKFTATLTSDYIGRVASPVEETLDGTTDSSD